MIKDLREIVMRLEPGEYRDELVSALNGHQETLGRLAH